MKKASTKKTQERRKSPRGSRAQKAAKTAVAKQHEESCAQCSADLKDSERALLVEEENGRLFCTEECISTFFSPEVERLEKQYFKLLSPGDLAPEEREKYSHLRWVTLEEPDEVWREKTLTGDHRYTLISEFKLGAKSIWCVCVCLFLRGEPSFLYLAFPTKNAAMVNQYRRGERMQWNKPKAGQQANKPPLEAGAEGDDASKTDGLAGEWTEEETRMATLGSLRRTDDIAPEDFQLYQGCLEQTLEAPDEVWSLTPDTDVPQEETSEDPLRVFHFLRHYTDQKPGHWYVIVARETEEGDQIEILEAFPTRDENLVQGYRQGHREDEAENETSSPSRLVH